MTQFFANKYVQCLLAMSLALPAWAGDPGRAISASEVADIEARAAFTVDLGDPMAEAILKMNGDNLDVYDDMSPIDNQWQTSVFPEKADCPGKIQMQVGQFDYKDQSTWWFGPEVKNCRTPKQAKVVCLSPECNNYIVITSWWMWQVRQVGTYLPKPPLVQLGPIAIKEAQCDIEFYAKSGGSN